MTEDVAITDIEKLMGRADVNRRALSATLYGISLPFLTTLWGKFTSVSCKDGSTAFILKNPQEAFEIYGKEWKAKLKIAADVLNKIKAEGDLEFSNKIVTIFENLNYVEATLREMYKNSYLTFVGNPCSKDNQEAKRKADKIIAAASLFLLTIKILAETQKNLEAVNDEIIKMLNKLIDLILK